MQTAASAERTTGNDRNIGGNWNQQPLPSRTLEFSRGAESGSAGEGRPSKRLYKDSSTGAIPPRPTEPTPMSSIRVDPLPTPANRRRQSSFREPKALLPPGSLQASPSKRLAYNALSDRHIVQRDKTPNALQEPDIEHSSVDSLSRFSFAPPPAISKRDTSHNSFDFLPSVSFDELHSNIGSVNRDISSIPAPGDSAGGNLNVRTTIAQRPGLAGPSKTIDPAELGSRISLNGSSLRRHNSSAQQRGQATTDADKMAPSGGPASARVRRKTYFPAAQTMMAVNNPAARAPRKSVGPGILTMDIGGTSHPHRRPTLAQAGLGEISTVSDSTDPSGRQNVSDTHSGGFGGSRHAKTKSLQPPPRKLHVPEQFFTPAGTPEQNFSSPIGMGRSPGRPNYPGTITPSSSKRMSIMPGSAHATGLGARTISPTDARRLKRMSMMPNAPPMPHTPRTPPTPQPDPSFSSEISHAPSPSMFPRKSVTPSSSRTTPDPNRKSYSSGVSNSSTTSYNSCLASSGSLRVSQSLSTSRLPTLKNRNDTGPIGDEESVPPVPAIPKVYESPKGEYEHPPFFSARKSSLGHDVSSLNTASASGDLPSPVDAEQFTTSQQIHQTKHHNEIDMDPASDRRPKNGANSANRRTLQPLRLPPLNLLPLSTPTASKIAALHEASAGKTAGNVTPPAKIGSKGTPTTPMTASKASFSRNFYEDESARLPAQIRSSSSHYSMRPEALSYRTPSSSSTRVPNPSDPYALTASRTAMSPFVSSSLPKTSGEFGYGRLDKSNTFDMATEAKSAKPTGPRLQKPRKASKDDASSLDTASSADTSMHSLGNSIRRKLSLTRKRSNSKAETMADRGAEPAPKPPKHDDMPPPKLPASATWNGPLLSNASPSQHVQQSGATRNASNSTVTPQAQQDRIRGRTWENAEIVKIGSQPKQNARNEGPKRTARANLEGTPIHDSLSLKDFLKEAKVMELTLDRDDLSAEDEMKKLASKRKETEIAAKEVDALRRRATAKERVGPNSALRIAQLNIFERGEIVDYKDVYFCGTKDAKKHVGDLSTEIANFGYDDDRGDYNIVPGDHLAYRYEIIDILGKGSFGQVVRCIDHKTGVLVAIKIIRNKKRFHQQALVEVEILQKLREWDPSNKHSMVNFVQSFYFRGHLCISTELLGMNLYEFIKCHDFRGFSLKLIRRFAKQLLSSLVLLKSKKVIHCDLKPENVLLAHPTRSEIKVIDFGSSCLENEKVYTYIQSRFYRSPEVILGMTYGMPIDMWSLGCILAELLTGYPIFPGENEQEQLACIMEVFGPPEKHLIEKSTRKKLFFDSLGKPRITVSTKGKRRRPSSKSLQQALKCEDEAFLDFISRCLRWDPDRRLKPDDAVHHEFITGKVNKNNARSRTVPQNSTSSPIKRYNSISQTPASTRPLPEPPATSFKNGSAVRTRDAMASSQSPSKPAVAPPGLKRHSTMAGVQGNITGTGVKRTLNGVTVQGSALPRVTSTSRVGTGGGKSVDLAAAAAAASLANLKSR